MQTRWLWSPGLAAACILTCAVNLDPAERHNPTPIILISVDTLRADHLSCYGYKGSATPNIDRITVGGTTFLQVNTQVPLTLPSHVSLLTSTYPFTNGVEDNGERLSPDATTLARVLKSQGYRTAAFVGGFVLDRRFGLDQGFDVYDGPSNPHPKPGRDPGDLKRFGEEVTHAATHWLEQNRDQPLFLFVHLYDLHTPYELPVSEYAHGSGYDTQLAYVDKVLGRFWDYLEKRGLIDRALVAFIADHGEGLHEHGESTHGYFIYQSTLHVPFIVHWPKESSPFVTRVSDSVSLMDVAPTLLRAVGLSPPAQFQGHSVLGLVTRAAPPAESAGPPEEIYSESLYPNAHFGTSALRTLRVGGYKLIQAPRPEFYDLVHDPEEKQNLYETQKLRALSFRARLESLRARYLSKRAPDSSALTPEAVERLRSLGYLAGSGSRASASDGGPDPKDRIGEYEAYGRAIALASADHLNESNSAFEQLLAKDPTLTDVRASLGLNQQKLGHHVEAAGNFKQVLKQDPLNVVAHFDLAVSDHSLGREDDAIKELEATLTLAPYYVRADEMLASLYLESKDYQRARRHLTHLIEIDPGNYTANYNLGVLDTLQGNWQEGERHLHAAIQSDPSSVEAHNTLGSLYLRRDNLEPARVEFAEAIRLNPQFASGHYNLGLIFQKQHNREAAVREFQAAISVDPGFRPARAALDRLKTTTGQNE